MNFKNKMRNLRPTSRAKAITVNEFYKMKFIPFSLVNHEMFKWAAARLFFISYCVVCVATFGSFGLITLPLASRFFFNTWCFWRVSFKYYPLLLIQAYRIFFKMIKDRNHAFLFSVSLTEPPQKSPDRNIVKLSHAWNTNENTCENCARCCEKIKCPLVDPADGTCISYDSFYWRYFLCGRYPTTQHQIDYYECPKWVLK